MGLRPTIREPQVCSEGTSLRDSVLPHQDLGARVWDLGGVHQCGFTRRSLKIVETGCKSPAEYLALFTLVLFAMPPGQSSAAAGLRVSSVDPLQTVVLAGSFQETKSAPGMPNSIRNVPQIPRPVDVAIQLHGAPLVIHLRPAIAIGCLHDGCGGLAWKQHNRLILAGEQHPDRPH